MITYLKFMNSSAKYYDAYVEPIDDVTIRVYNAPHNTSGIGMYSEDGVLVGDYRKYRKDYKKSKSRDNIYMYKRKEL